MEQKYKFDCRTCLVFMSVVDSSMHKAGICVKSTPKAIVAEFT